MKKILNFTKKHKIWSGAIFLSILAGGYLIYRSAAGNGETVRYALAKAEKKDIVVSVSGTGQVSAENQIDVTARSGGELVYLNAQIGKEVKAGTLIGETDPGNTKYELETARLSYQKLLNGDKKELSDAEDAFEKASADLEDSYVAAEAALASAMTDMNDVLSDTDALFSGYLDTNGRFNLTKTEKSYIDKAQSEYYKANDLLRDLSKKYRSSGSMKNDAIESMLSEANKVANEVSLAAKYAKDAVVYMRDQEDTANSEADDAYTKSSELVTTINSTVSETLAKKNSLTEAKRAKKSAEDDLNVLKDGPDELDVRGEELSLKQKEDAYADHFARAPFDGIIADVPVKKGENLSNGAVIATVITRQKVAEISLNEVDAAKVHMGDSASLSFDAADDIKAEGKVIEIDMVGTVEQGVVSYGVKIGFEASDERIKPGMTVSADITVEKKSGVLAVSAGAVKSVNDKSYVEVMEGGMPRRAPVTIGISNDELTEITSGLSEGQEYVAKTLNASQAAAAPSLLGGGGKTNVRIPR